LDRYLVMLIGNIASGKSTMAKRFDKAGYLCVSSDSIRYMFHPNEYIFGADQEYAVHTTEVSAVRSIMELGFNVCVDDAGSSIKDRREWMIELAKQNGYKVIAVKMPNLAKHVSVRRRLKSNHGKYDKKRWEQVYDMFQKTNCPPTIKEGFYGIYHHNSSSLRSLLEVR